MNIFLQFISSKTYWKIVGIIIVVIAIAALSVFSWQRFFAPKPEPVHFVPQEVASTPQGVSSAADKAQIPFTPEQADDAARQLQDLFDNNSRPNDVIRTTASAFATTVEHERNQAGADFSMVTDPKNPRQTPTVQYKTAEVVTNISDGGPFTTPDQPIMLNQYNIQAYPQQQLHLQYFDKQNYSAGIEFKFKTPRLPLLSPKGTVGYIGPAYLHTDTQTMIGISVTVSM